MEKPFRRKWTWNMSCCLWKRGGQSVYLVYNSNWRRCLKTVVPGICKLPRPWAFYYYKFAVSSPGFLDIVFHHSADSALVSKSRKIWFLYIAQPAHIPAKTEFPRMASCNSSGSTRASRRASQSSTAITEMPFNSASTVGRVRRENRCQAILDCSSIRP